MTRRSRRELEAAAERLDDRDRDRAEHWRAYITGEISPEEYRRLEARGERR